MSGLKNIIIKNINLNNGFITLDKFIKICMYDKRYGYYIKNNPIGKKGDFVTSPEISQLFGEIIGLYIVDYWKNNINKNFNLIELGPGRGALIYDILNISSKFPQYLSSINLKLIEINKKLIEYQNNILKKKIDGLKKISWSSKLKNIPNNKTVIIANEFFDCFPIKQTYRFNNNYFERVIRFNREKNKLVFDKIKINDKGKLAKKTYRIYKENNLKEGSIVELEIDSKKYINNIGNILLKNNGIFIMFDYGNICPNGHSTIQSVKSHEKTDFLADPGNQDLSHMLDFSLFIKKFLSMNLKVYGPYTQKNFFTSLGIHKLKDKILQNSSSTQKIQIENGLKRILEDSEMGKLFKVIIVSSKKIEYYEK